MPLQEHQLEPICREIAHFLIRADVPISSRWGGYDREKDLIPYRRVNDDVIDYRRADEGQARFHVFGLDGREGVPDPKTIEVLPVIVLDSKQVAAVTQEVDNRMSKRPSEPLIWTKEFDTGKSELEAFETSFENETKITASASVSGGVPGAEAEASVETETRNLFRAAYSRSTGVTENDKKGGTFSLVADPETFVKAVLEWEEQTLQRRIKMKAKIDFGFRIGRRRKVKRKGWQWASGHINFKSIDHLIAVAERRGRVEYDLYHHFAKHNLSKWAKKSLERIKELRYLNIDKLTPEFKGADSFKVVIIEQETAGEGEDE